MKITKTIFKKEIEVETHELLALFKIDEESYFNVIKFIRNI